MRYSKGSPLQPFKKHWICLSNIEVLQKEFDRVQLLGDTQFATQIEVVVERIRMLLFIRTAGLRGVRE